MIVIEQIKQNLHLSFFSIVWKWRLKKYYLWKIRFSIKAKITPMKVLQKKRPKILYIVGMPRTGSTLVKRFLGEHEHLKILPKKPYQKSYALALENNGIQILVDKSTDNIDQIHNIHDLAGENAWFLGVIRDPRDELTSLSETDRHSAVPHNRTFWPYWVIRYSRLLESFKVIANHGGNVAIVRYEDLVQNPVQIKELFGDWLNLDMNGITSKYSSSVEEIADGTNKSEDWKVHQHNAVHNDSLHRWRKADKNIRETAYIWKNYKPAKNIMSKFGYDGDQVLPIDVIEGVTVFNKT
ncbi:MAG: sulfotransferase [Candidatus Reddybacter sp.]